MAMAGESSVGKGGVVQETIWEQKGDYVVLFQPRKLDKLHNEWQGPVTVTKKSTDITYEVDMGHGPKGMAHSILMVWRSGTPQYQPYFFVDDNPNEEPSEDKEDCYISTLSDCLERELLELRKKFADVISDDPGKW